MCHLKHMLRICFNRLIYVSFSRYSIFRIFNHPMIYQIYDVMMSISTWDRVHFWIYILNQTSLVHQIGQLIDIKNGNNFQESFDQFGGLELRSKSFSIYQPAPITNYARISVFHFYKKVNTGNGKSAIKNGLISLYCHFNEIMKGSVTRFQSPVLSQKHVGNVCYTAH